MTLHRVVSYNEPPPMCRPLRIELPKRDWDALLSRAAMAQTAAIASEARAAFARVGEAARTASKQAQGAATHISEGFKHANKPRDPRVKVSAVARS